MQYRLCFAVLAGVLATTFLPAYAAPQQPMTPPAGSTPFQGTPEEQRACSPDTTKFCSEEVPDTFKVLACLQDNREKLRKACLKVLEDHGQ
ncbi:MAG: cysteine rich repeat-containing protein [Pseudolabrys sp.]